MRRRAHSTNASKYQSNLNNFDYHTCNPNDISFMSQLREPIESHPIHQGQPPLCYGKTIRAQETRHISKDITTVADICPFDHLVRKTRPIGNLLYETSLRNYDKLPPTRLLDHSRISKAMSSYKQGSIRENKSIITIQSKKLKTKPTEQLLQTEPYTEITEKNFQIYQHAVREGSYGTVRSDQIQWLVSLKKYDKKNNQQKQMHSRSMSIGVSNKK